MADLVTRRACPWCGSSPGRRHFDYCPCSAENRRAVKRAYAISDEMGRTVADSIRANAQREANRV